MGWVFHEGGQDVRPIYVGTVVGQPFLTYGDTNTNFWIGAGGPSSERAVDPGAAVLNEWLFYMGTYDGTNLRLYRGYGGSFSLRATMPSVVAAPSTATSYIGRRWDDARIGLQGYLAEIAYFNTPLSLSDGQAIYDARNSGSYASTVIAENPVAYWRLRELFPSTTAEDEEGIADGTYQNVEFNSDPSDYDYRLMGTHGPITDQQEGWGMLI